MAREESYVQRRIEELDGSALSSVKKEVSELHTILYSDEAIYAVACGQIGSDMHLMTVTDRRILLTYKSIMGKTQLLELPLNQVKSVSQKTGLLLAELLIDTGGQTKRFKNVPKVLAENVTTAVSNLLHSTQTKIQQNTNLNNSLETLEKLGELKEKGIITEEEFTTRKNTILGGVASSQPQMPAESNIGSTLTKTDKEQTPKKKRVLRNVLCGVFLVIIALAAVGIFTSKDKEQSNNYNNNITKQEQKVESKSFSWTHEQLMAKYNNLIKNIDLPPATKKDDKDGENLPSYKLTKFSSVMFNNNAEGRTTMIIFNFGGDGSEHTGMKTTGSLLMFFTALIEDKQVRKEVFEKIGITDSSFFKRENKDVIVANFKISSALMKGFGIYTIFILPN